MLASLIDDRVECGSCRKLLATRPYKGKKLDGAEVLKEPTNDTTYWNSEPLEIKCSRCKELNQIIL